MVSMLILIELEKYRVMTLRPMFSVKIVPVLMVDIDSDCGDI